MSRPALPDAPDRESARALAALIARALDDKQAQRVVVLEVTDVLGVTDEFVIASAPNTRLVRTLADEAEQRVKDAGGPAPWRVEGRSDLAWVLLDYGEVVVHLFLEENRSFYDLERLYRDCPEVAWEMAREG